jgi:hypothetical protein
LVGDSAAARGSENSKEEKSKQSNCFSNLPEKQIVLERKYPTSTAQNIVISRIQALE